MYRAPPTIHLPAARAGSLWSRLGCWAEGHRWAVLTWPETRGLVSGHARPDATFIFECARCGARWDDRRWPPAIR